MILVRMRNEHAVEIIRAGPESGDLRDGCFGICILHVQWPTQIQQDSPAGLLGRQLDAGTANLLSASVNTDFHSYSVPASTANKVPANFSASPARAPNSSSALSNRAA